MAQFYLPFAEKLTRITAADSAALGSVIVIADVGVDMM